MKLLLIVVWFYLLTISNSYWVAAHDGDHGHRKGQGGIAAQDPGETFEIPGVNFRILSRSADDLDAVRSIYSAFSYMVEHRTDFRHFDETLKRDALESVEIETKVINHEGKEFFILVARTKTPGRVKLMISSSQLKEKNYSDPKDLVLVLAKEFQWVISKSETGQKPKTVTSERELQRAQILNDPEILKMSGELRVKALRSLYNTYLRTIDEQKSLENQPYYEAGSESFVNPDSKDSTVKFYDIRIRQALEKIVSESEFSKKYPRAVQSLLNGKIWNVSFVKVDDRDWATRTRVLTEEKAIKVGPDARVIQPASILINYHRKAVTDDPYFNAVVDLPMGALSVDELAQVIAIEIESNIIEKSMRGHTVTDQLSAPK
jgi:hypothetical protein